MIMAKTAHYILVFAFITYASICQSEFIPHLMCEEQVMFISLVGSAKSTNDPLCIQNTTHTRAHTTTHSTALDENQSSSVP